MTRVDLTGQQFGRLLVLGENFEQPKRRRWLCKCSCGTMVIVRQDALASGKTKSCGCYQRDVVSTEIIDGQKRCSVCGELKPLSEFHIDNSMKSGFKSICKSCVTKDYHKNKELRSTTTKKWKLANREKCREYDRTAKDNKSKFIDNLKSPCAKCCDDRLYVIEFHHIEPNTKLFSIGCSSKKYDAITEESKKCVCLCSNCHKEFHHLYGMNPQKPKELLYKYLTGGNEDV